MVRKTAPHRLFRRLSATAWAHLGGLGRGKGWAGIVTLTDVEEPWLDRVPDAIGAVCPFTFELPTRVLGPYYATAGALVRDSSDVVVLLGNPSQPLAADASTQALVELAVDLDASSRTSPRPSAWPTSSRCCTPYAPSQPSPRPMWRELLSTSSPSPLSPCPARSA